MTNTNETLSAFLDSELNGSESNEQISQVSKDVNAAYRMQRYHIIGDAMRGDLGESIQLDFAASVSAQIAQLEPLAKPSGQQANLTATPSFIERWFKPLSGIAVAASVALVAVVSLQSLMPVESINGELTKRAEQVAINSPQVDVSQQVNRLAQLPVSSNVVSVSAPVLKQNNLGSLHWNAPRSQDVSQAKLNAYLVTHTEYSSSMHGMIPQARVAAFDVNSQ